MPIMIFALLFGGVWFLVELQKKALSAVISTGARRLWTWLNFTDGLPEAP